MAVIETVPTGERRGSFSKLADKFLRKSTDTVRSSSSTSSSKVEFMSGVTTFPLPGDADWPTPEDQATALKAKLQAQETQRRAKRDAEINAITDASQAAQEKKQEAKRCNEYILRRDAFVETSKQLIPELNDLDDGETYERVRAARTIEKLSGDKADAARTKERTRRESFNKKRDQRVADFRKQMNGSILHSLAKPIKR